MKRPLSGQPRPVPVAASRPAMTARTVAWLVLRRAEKRSADDQALLADYDAGRATVATVWRNGPTEGQINRLKTIKRQMYGRAKLDLLGRRFLLAVSIIESGQEPECALCLTDRVSGNRCCLR